MNRIAVALAPLILAASASSADPAAEQTDEQAGKASETTEAEGADA